MTEAIVGSRGFATTERTPSAVAWAAVVAGAIVASAFSLALVSLGAGLGLIAVSPWSSGISVTTFGILAAAWFIAVQLFSSGLGGYIAGRLRLRLTGAPSDEIFFRDSAHGLLVWALGAVISALLLAGAASSLVSGAARTGAAAVGEGSVRQGAVADPTAYFTDMLFRSDRPTAQNDASPPRAEAGRILTRGVAAGDLPAADRSYLAQIVAARTGLAPADADKRVSDVFDQAKAAAAAATEAAKTAAEAARKTAVTVSLWAFISLLIGAFAASYMAVLGGQVRDELSPGG